MKTFVLLITIAIIVAGCTRSSDGGFSHARLSADVEKGAAVRLSGYTAFDWDRVHVFGPYTPATAIKEEIGKSVSFPHSDSEGHCLLVFLLRGQIQATFEVERKTADFAELIRKGGYSQEEAVFTVGVRASDAWQYLKTANQLLEPTAASGRGSP